MSVESELVALEPSFSRSVFSRLIYVVARASASFHDCRFDCTHGSKCIYPFTKLGPEFFVGKYLIINSIALLFRGLFTFSIFSRVNFGSLCVSRLRHF